MPEDKLRVIYSGVDTEAFHPRLKALHRQSFAKNTQQLDFVVHNQQVGLWCHYRFTASEIRSFTLWELLPARG